MNLHLETRGGCRNAGRFWLHHNNDFTYIGYGWSRKRYDTFWGLSTFLLDKLTFRGIMHLAPYELS